MKARPIEERTSLTCTERSRLFRRLEKILWKDLIIESVPIEKLSGKISRSLPVLPDASVPDCLTCGLCCVLTFNVQLAHKDSTKSENYWNITRAGAPISPIIDRILRRDAQTGKCKSLIGEIGENVECGIYEDRPQTCRTFDAGSDKCHALRRAVGFEPPLAHGEIFNALMKLLERDSVENEDDLRIVRCRIALKGRSATFKVTVFAENDERFVIHEFDPQIETWLEGDFTGINLAEARTLIGRRTSG